METVPAEHIIPNNIGGTVVTYEVCEKCNHIFSSFDVELHKHRHIYDSYKTITPESNLKLEFRFIDCFTDHPEGGRVKFIPKNTSKEIITSKIHDGLYICDCNASEKNDFYLQRIKEIQKEYTISDEFISKHLKRYYDFKRDCVPGSVYRDGFLTDVEIHIESKMGKRQTLMNAKTPHRFIAKACVEYSSLLGISEEIANIEDLKLHAKFGGLVEKSLKFFSNETSKDNGVPFHFINFTQNHFFISFFGKWGTAVEIFWRNSPIQFYLANDILNKKLIECNYSNGEIEITNIEYKFVKHFEIKRKTHIRR